MRLFKNRKYKSGIRWCFWRWTDIDPMNEGSPYMTRLHIFQLPICSLIVHWIHRPDPQPDLHDHPVTFLSIILRGGYWEEREVNGVVEYRRARFWNFIRATDKHRIISLNREPTMTLMFASKVVRGWGFWTKEGWVPWREYKKSIG